MDVPLLVAGVLFAAWPLLYRRSFQRIQERLRGAGDAAERFERTMNRTWIRASLVVVPVIGVGLIILGIAGW